MEKIDKVTSSQRLRRERRNRSLSQEEVAEKIGSTATNVSRWESGQTSPTPFFRRKLCELFEKSAQELFPLSSQEPSIFSSEHFLLQPSPSQRAGNASNAVEGQGMAYSEPQKGEEYRGMNSVFRFNTSLTDAREFFGRRGECIPLLRRLRLRSSVSLIGQRRIGKTWLLSYLRLVAPTQLGSGYRIGYVDATLPSCNTLDDFTVGLLEAAGISSFERSTTNEHLIRLEQAVKELAEKQETLVLCIDEFESLCEKAGFQISVLERLRAMTNLGLCLLTASREPLLGVVTEKVGKSGETSPFFNVFEQITLKPFVRKEAEAFAQAKSIQAGFTAQEHAYLLQFGQEEEGNQQWPPLRLQLVGKMIEEDKILSEQEPLYPFLPTDAHYWQEFKARLKEKYRGVVG